MPVLSGISPAHLRGEHSTFKLALQAQLNTNNPLHAFVHSAQFLGTQRLHARRPFHRHAAVLLNSCFNLLESWRVAWKCATPPTQFLVTPAVCLLSGSELPRSLWAGPALSRCNRCRRIGSRASGAPHLGDPAPWCLGRLLIFFQISLALENSVQMAYKSHY